MTQLVKFWMGNISFTSDFTGLSKEEIEKEFIEWLIDKSDAGWEVLEGEKKEISLDEENVREYMVYECPHCDGNKNEIDDNDDNGTKTCYYCDGKGWVSYDEAEAYRQHDPNLM